MNGVQGRTVRENGRNDPVAYGATHIRTKCEKAGKNPVENQIFHMGHIRGDTGKGMIPGKTESGRLPPCCNMGEPVRS